jgi:hypothetical protein
MAPDVKPVRFSLDLDRSTHRYLKRFVLDCDTDASRVMRALLAEMQADDDLADKVRGRCPLVTDATRAPFGVVCRRAAELSWHTRWHGCR